MVIHINKKIKPKPSVVFETYWKFAAERQEVFFKRLNNYEYPWTDDKVLLNYKFTNAYRAADRVSQYLIKEVIYKGSQEVRDVIFRILLFKIFNKIETWTWLERNLGELRWGEFDLAQYIYLLYQLKQAGRPIYSGAYIMTSGKSSYGFDLKHENHLALIKEIMSSDFTERIINSTNMEEGFEILKSYPTIGDFLAYQYITDLNYSKVINFSEMEFVKAGPGAKDGIKKCFSSMGDYSHEDIIKYTTEYQEFNFERLDICFKDLWGRPLQLIDCQNLFCEVDKYSRIVHPEVSGYSDRKRIKQKFKANRDGIDCYWFPPKWEINHMITNTTTNEQ